MIRNYGPAGAQCKARRRCEVCANGRFTHQPLFPTNSGADDKSVFCADLRREPLEVRKATLASVLAAAPGLRLNEHITEPDGAIVFAHACKLGLEGIVSKRKDSRYRSGRSPRLAQDEEPGMRGGAARGGGRLEQVTGACKNGKGAGL